MIQGRMNTFSRTLAELNAVLSRRNGNRLLIVFAPLEDFTDRTQGRGIPCLVSRQMASGWEDLADVLQFVDDPQNRTTGLFRYMPMDGAYYRALKEIEANEETPYTVIGAINEEVHDHE